MKQVLEGDGGKWIKEGEPFVIFTLKEHLFGIYAMQVREILRVSELTSLPQAFSFMEGMLNLRGRILPVLDLRKRFKLPADHQPSNRIMVVRLPKALLGLLVDSVKEVVKIRLDTIQKTVETGIQDLNFQGLSGIAHLGKDLIFLPDLTSLLKAEEQEQLAAINRRKETTSP